MARRALAAACAAIFLSGCGAGYVQQVKGDAPPALHIQFDGYGVRPGEVVFTVEQVSLVETATGRVAWKTLPLETLAFTPGEPCTVVAGDAIANAVNLPHDFQFKPATRYHYLAQVAVGPRSELHTMATRPFVYSSAAD
jgi:hypothetical protein